jgi:hypothetical protein
LETGLMNYFPSLALNHDPPDLSLPSSEDCRCETQAPNLTFLRNEIENSRECTCKTS